MQPQQPPIPPYGPPQPSQPAYPPQVAVPSPTANYDFIINPAKPARKSLFSGGGGSNSMALRLLVVLGGLFILAIIAAGLVKALGTGGSFNKAASLAVAQDQTEILHLTDTGVTTTVSDSAKNIAISTKLSVTSQQATFAKYLQSHHFKPKGKLLAAKQSVAVDSSLTSAQASSTFDSSFSSALKDALTAYRNDLSAAYPKADATGKAILSNEYNQAGLLLTQLSSDDS